jgi:hypothetical protein
MDSKESIIFVQVDASDGNNVEIEERLITRPRPTEPTYYGTLNKDQLDRYRRDECWSTCRWLLVLLIVLFLVALIIMTIYLIYITPKCAKIDKGWWANSVIYEVTFLFQNN